MNTNFYIPFSLRSTFTLAWMFALIQVLTAVGPGELQAQDQPPNVVFIMADDLGYNDLSCYGAEKVDTPNVDRLAEQGMRFTDAHSPSSVCTPTRYSVLTGRYAWRTWLKNWVLMPAHPLLIDTDRLTMGRLFQKHGYRTVCVGKWHLGWGRNVGMDKYNGTVKPGPLEVGFDDYFGVPFSHNSPDSLKVFMRDRRIVGLKQGEDFRDKNVMKRTRRKLERTAIELSREAVSYIEENRDHPFFLYYPTTNVHFPITPNERFRGESRAGKYGDFVVEFDWAVGQVLDALDRLDLADETIVVVTSDNGGRYFGQHDMNGHDPNTPWRGKKRLIYEGGHRVPLIVRWPERVEAGSISDETVCLTDFMRTFASMLGHDLPADAAEDSYDLSPVLFGKEYESPLREATVQHSVNGTFSLRKGNWKLIEAGDNGDYESVEGMGRHDNMAEPGFPTRNPDTGEFYPLIYAIRNEPEGDPELQLYNLAEDPDESENLADKRPEKAQSMLKLLKKYRRQDRSAPR